MFYALLKALHVISMVAWMAATLYLGRLCVYFVETATKSELDQGVLRAQLSVMMRRLMYCIGHPAMLLTIVFGTWLMIRYQIILQPWFHLKLTLALAFVGYYLYLSRIARNLMSHGRTYSTVFLRVLNEISTAFLVSIILMAYLKSALSPMESVVMFLSILTILIGLVFLVNCKKGQC